MQKNEFEIMYNALSVGWHLRRIMEAVKEKSLTKEERKRFVGWLKRHKIYEDEQE